MTSFVACIGDAEGMNQKLEEGTQFRKSEVWNREGGNPLVIMVCHVWCKTLHQNMPGCLC